MQSAGGGAGGDRSLRADAVSPGRFSRTTRALREVRVFAYESVWIESPGSDESADSFRDPGELSDPALSPKRVTSP